MKKYILFFLLLLATNINAVRSWGPYATSYNISANQPQENVTKNYYLDTTINGDIGVQSISSADDVDISVVLGSDAGDNFSIDTNGFVYRGNDNRIGIGTTSPLTKLHITSATSFEPVIIIENTNDDAGCADYRIYKLSGSPANNDNLGFFSVFGNDSASNLTRFGRIQVQAKEVLNGSETGKIFFKTMVSGSETEILTIDASNVGIGTTVPSQKLDVVGNIKINGGMFVKRTAVAAADYNPSALTTDYIIAFTDTSAARACTISTEDVQSGSTSVPRKFVIKDEAGDAATGNITVTLESGGTIDGSASVVISTAYNSVTLYVDGTNGHIE